VLQEQLDLVGWSYILWTKAMVIEETSMDEKVRRAAKAMQIKALDTCLESFTNSLPLLHISNEFCPYAELDRSYARDPRRFIAELSLKGEGPMFVIEALKVDLTEQLAAAMEASGLTAETLAERMRPSIEITAAVIKEQLHDPDDLPLLLLMFHSCGMKLATNAIKIAEGNSDAD
jgi:hypothetical protein